MSRSPGATAYAIALLSYTDNRSSTYLLPYVTLPLLMAGALWLALLLRRRARRRRRAPREAGCAFALALAVLMIAAAWPQIEPQLRRRPRWPTRIRAAACQRRLTRLWHPPPIDPRAPEGERLLNRYMPGRRALVVLPTVPDLGVEILMRSEATNTHVHRRSGRRQPRPVGVDAEARPRRSRDCAPGQRLLIDRAALTVLLAFAADPSIDPSRPPDRRRQPGARVAPARRSTAGSRLGRSTATATG